MKYKDLLEQHSALMAEGDALLASVEDREFSAEEEARYDAIAAQLTELNTKMASARSLDGRRDQLRALGSAVPPPPAPTVTPTPARPALSPEAAAGPQPKTEFENSAEFMAAVAMNPSDPRLASLWRPSLGAATTHTTTSTRGGYAIPPAFLNTLLKVDPQGEIIEPRATVLPRNEENPEQTLHIPALDQSDQGESPTVPKVFGGVQVSWIGEGAEKPQTDFKVREITLTPYEVAGSLDITDRLLRNWRAAGSVVDMLLRGAMSAAKDSAYLAGDGSSKPQGIIGAACTLAVTRQAPSQFTYLDATSMENSFLQGGGGAWIINPTMRQWLLRMQDPEGHYIWQPNAREGDPTTLLGRPILWNYRSPVPGVAGDVVLADLSKYLILPGTGPMVAASEHVRFRENTTVFKCFLTTDGKPWLTQPFMQEDGLSYSPFVKLV